MTTAIWWIRRDLRLHDNPAFARAFEVADRVLPLFILDPALLNSPYVGEKRLWFLFQGLQALQRDLRARGADLLLRRGTPEQVLPEIIGEVGAGAVFAQEDFSPYARRRDERAGKTIDLRLTPGVAVCHPEDVLKDDRTPYTVYTPYNKRWKAGYRPRTPLPVPENIPAPRGIAGEPLPVPPNLENAQTPFLAGETEALRRLDAFVEGLTAPIHAYDEGRNMVAEEGTSLLSPYLRFGMLSPRVAVEAAYRVMAEADTPAAARGAEAWLNELVWREFFISILYHFPYVREMSFREAYRGMNWENDEAAFMSWCAGKTGFPLVDAGMRQLREIGWIHNRARMVAASFLTKDLLVDWRWGERWFMQHLVDGDPAANNGGWQWVAGTGTDAAPYFRIFNPVSQSRKFDPEGAYIRRWVPELHQVPGKYIHEPWLMPEVVQREAGCVIGRNYPAPIIDRKWARARTLEAYKAARG